MNGKVRLNLVGMYPMRQTIPSMVLEFPVLIEQTKKKKHIRLEYKFENVAFYFLLPNRGLPSSDTIVRMKSTTMSRKGHR